MTFTISDTASLVGLSAKQIRDYETHDLIHPIRSPSGYRLYDDNAVARLHFIAHAREVGFSLAQIKELLALQQNPHRHSCDVKALTAKHIKELSDKIAQLSAMKQRLQAWHDACLGDSDSDCAILTALKTH